MNRIVAICLLHNEDRFLNRILSNLLNFADEILIADHLSSDQTPDIAKAWAAHHSHIQYRRIQHPRASHDWICEYINQPVWAFGVDGDEIYDPEGLARLRPKLQQGEYDHFRQLYGHAFHCEAIDTTIGLAQGYATPPCRTITKLYNFNAYQDWEGPCPERLHGGTIRFHDGWTAEDNAWLYKQQSWEECDFRCLHTVFMRRSSHDQEQRPPRQNISERNQTPPIKKFTQWIHSRFRGPTGSAYKQDKYARGDLLERNVKHFFPDVSQP